MKGNRLWSPFLDLSLVFSASQFVLFPVLFHTHGVNVSVLMSGSMVLQRNAGSSSDGTEDSDFSTDLEHTDSSESDGTSRRSARVTRSSARLSQSSQGKRPLPSSWSHLTAHWSSRYCASSCGNWSLDVMLMTESGTVQSKWLLKCQVLKDGSVGGPVQL